GQKAVEGGPAAITTRLSGMLGGNASQACLRATRAIAASPMKKTSLPNVPVCQPITAIVGPTDPEPAYQSVKAEMLRTSPAIQVARAPTVVMLPGSAGARPAGFRLTPPSGRGSSVATVEVWASSWLDSRVAESGGRDEGIPGKFDHSRRWRREASSGRRRSRKG